LARTTAAASKVPNLRCLSSCSSLSGTRVLQAQGVRGRRVVAQVERVTSPRAARELMLR
jgi:hypothetical protein